MGTSAELNARHVTQAVRNKIEHGGERLWRYEDFKGLPFSAVAQALSRLARSGKIQRLSKGTYYKARETSFGLSRPNPAAIQQLAAKRGNVFPAGLAAANLLGFSTQNPRRAELATSGLSLPRKLVGADAVVHTRRPQAWTTLSPEEAAFLDFLRQGGKTTELSPEETVKRVLSFASSKGRFRKLLQIADTEPPRVRAILGAIGEQLGANNRTLKPLRESLNPLSTFDFGVLAHLSAAKKWQAKDSRHRETV